MTVSIGRDLCEKQDLTPFSLLCRYVERNPVAAGMVSTAQGWPWSSFRAHLFRAAMLPWLDSDGLHGHLLERPVVGTRDRQRAAQQYADLVANLIGTDAPFWQEGLREEGLRQQVLLSDEAFALVMARAIGLRVQTHGAPSR